MSILADDDPASVIHAFITFWLEYGCVINLAMTPTALRKLQLIEKAGTYFQRHHGNTKPPYRNFTWNFSSSSNSFSTTKKTDCNSLMKFVIMRSALLLWTMRCKWDKAYLSEFDSSWDLEFLQVQKNITSFSSSAPSSSSTLPFLM